METSEQDSFSLSWKHNMSVMVLCQGSFELISVSWFSVCFKNEWGG